MEKRSITAGMITAFKTQLIREEKSAATVEKYVRDAAAFAAFMQGGTITKETAIAYKAHLQEQGKALY